MPVVPLLKTRNYFISPEGYVLKIENGKEVIIKPFRTKRSNDVYVKIDKSDFNLLFLMIQHFIGDIKITDKYKFTVTKEDRIPLGSIRVTNAIGNYGLTAEDEAKMFNYKCDVKANSANYRCAQKLTAIEVFKVLAVHDYKCIYCGVGLLPNLWHLDHFKSLATGGQNIFENLVSSCNICNTMKGPLEGNQFYALCCRISKNYLFKEQLQEMKMVVLNHQKKQNHGESFPGNQLL